MTPQELKYQLERFVWYIRDRDGVNISDDVVTRFMGWTVCETHPWFILDEADEFMCEPCRKEEMEKL